MRIAMIGCMVMNREISLLTAKSENIIRVWWLRQGLHDTPDVLRAQLNRKIRRYGKASGFRRLFWRMVCVPTA